MTPNFHLFLPQMRMTPGTIVERAIAAEASGFEGIAFMDHLAPPLALEHDMWEAMTIAGWVLAHTTSLKVGHLVLCDAFRHPAVLARQVTSLDHASDGRFELGIGWGSTPTELETFGVGSSEAKGRVGRLSESLDIMRQLWTGEMVDYQGAHFTVIAAQQRPTPSRPIPIIIGGVGNRTLELVRRYADWCNLPINHLGKLDEIRDKAGNARVSIQPMVALLPDESHRDKVTQLAQRRFGGNMASGGIMIGTAGQLADQFIALRNRGVDRFYVWFTDFAPIETLEGFQQVIVEVHRACSG